MGEYTQFPHGGTALPIVREINELARLGNQVSRRTAENGWPRQGAVHRHSDGTLGMIARKVIRGGREAMWTIGHRRFGRCGIEGFPNELPRGMARRAVVRPL